jgi:capsular exopolysaccharide synthesis family protein
MDTIDRPDSNVPARYPGDSPRMLAPLAATSRDLAVAPQPSSLQVTPRILMRGLIRHWWRIMLCWLVVSIPLAYAIYEMVEPTYQATSLLRAEPTSADIYGSALRGVPNIMADRPYLSTQVQLIVSDRVLDQALADPAIANLPMVRSSKDPKSEIRQRMGVGIVGETYLIQVALSSRDPNEAAAIVNAVVEAYTSEHTRYQQAANRSLKKNLETERDKLVNQIVATQKELTELVKEGRVTVEKRLEPSQPGKDDAGPLQPSFKSVTESQYMSAAQELLETDMRLIETQAALETAEDLLARAQERIAEGGPQRSPQDDEQLRRRIVEEFKRDPDVVPLIDQINQIKEALGRARESARRPDDPAIAHHDKQYQRLLKQWDELWKLKQDEIAARLADGENERPEVWAARIVQAKTDIERLKKKQALVKGMIQALHVENTAQNSDQFRANELHQDLAYLKRLQESIKIKLGSLEFEMGQEAYRITVQDKAAVPQVPSLNKRMKYLAAAPLGVMFFLLGLFLLVEIKAERVGDPDALSTRVQSEVYALPPLPTMRSIRKRGADDPDDQIEQFIQRLDHLRFAVCGNPAELEKGRCVLITSSVGGEGKTTLAAQLAARCGNAGMSTLLIDADLRRTGLCSLLDVAEGPGLSDALTSDETAPTELVVPVQGGTFHLLPAGTPIQDTSRVLQNRKLGLLISQFRQLYDLVIIDSPPILPVPDALILGRWVDGAVLAVRYDISRFPQVERARRQLDGAGVAVLGTVINGMKNSDSYYGRYSYGRRRSPQADADAPATS